MKTELHGRLDTALAMGTGALVLTAFIAVGREGLETALFLWANAQATGSSTQPLLGAVLGLSTACVLGYLIYRRAVAIDLAKFFTWTGAALIVVAAGVLSYAVHDLWEAGIVKFGTSTAWDITSWYSATSWYGSILKGIFNFSPNPRRDRGRRVVGVPRPRRCTSSSAVCVSACRASRTGRHEPAAGRPTRSGARATHLRLNPRPST